MGKAAGSLPKRRDEDESSLPILVEYDGKKNLTMFSNCGQWAGWEYAKGLDKLHALLSNL